MSYKAAAARAFTVLCPPDPNPLRRAGNADDDSTSRRAAATPTAATHEHHFSTKVAVQYRLQHVNDRITQDAQLVLTAVPEDADVDADDDDDDVVVVTSKMTVQRARPALHTATTVRASRQPLMRCRSLSPTIRTSPARRSRQ